MLENFFVVDRKQSFTSDLTHRVFGCGNGERMRGRTYTEKGRQIAAEPGLDAVCHSFVANTDVDSYLPRWAMEAVLKP